MEDIKLVRNVAIFGHGKCGKTSLAEALLFTAGKTKRLGKVDDGSSVMDYEPEETDKKLTISSSFNNYTWQKHSVFITDTPGDDNFLNDTLFAAKVSDCGLFVIGAALGVKSQTEKIASFISDNNLPAIIYINKMDRERANFENTLNGIKAELQLKPAVCQIPIGAEDNFKGIVDLIKQKAFMFDGDSGKVKETEIPADMADMVGVHRESLMEMVAETDDELIEKFLEEGELQESDLINGLKEGIAKAEICPVCVGSATMNAGTALLLDMINDLLPSSADRPARVATNPDTEDMVEIIPAADEPFSAQVFKTISDPYTGQLTIFRIFSGTLSGDTLFNSSRNVSEKFSQAQLLEGKNLTQTNSAGPGMIVALAKLKDTKTGDTLCDPSRKVILDPLVPFEPNISYAVSSASGDKKDDEKLFASLNKILEEDPTLKVVREQATKQTLISGIGQAHLDITGQKLKRKFGVEMQLDTPKVPYKETIKGKAKVQGKHKKQTGGHGQYADSWIEIEPLPRGGGFEFEDRIVGGVIPKQFIPAVEKGVIEAMEKGALAGFPVVDVKVALVDGSFHSVDSSEMAFKISGSMAFKKGAQEAKPVLLEPIMDLQIRVPKDAVGDVIGDLNGRRGRVMGMDSESKSEVISAQVPMAEILRYAPDLTSITGGRGSFTSKFSHYDEVPGPMAEKVIEQANAGQAN